MFKKGKGYSVADEENSLDDIKVDEDDVSEVRPQDIDIQVRSTATKNNNKPLVMQGKKLN
jgi:hypothetical protein